jgi:hypothetical protein
MRDHKRPARRWDLPCACADVPADATYDLIPSQKKAKWLRTTVRVFHVQFARETFCPCMTPAKFKAISEELMGYNDRYLPILIHTRHPMDILALAPASWCMIACTTVHTVGELMFALAQARCLSNLGGIASVVVLAASFVYDSKQPLQEIGEPKFCWRHRIGIVLDKEVGSLTKTRVKMFCEQCNVLYMEDVTTSKPWFHGGLAKL